jgi:hypothetical protein
MGALRIKIDVWSQGVDEHIRGRNRQLLVAEYLRLPPRRVWLWIKGQRLTILGAPDDAGTKEISPEDVIAKGTWRLKGHLCNGWHGLKNCYSTLRHRSRGTDPSDVCFLAKRCAV